jgi:hypothetical protein
MWILIRRQKNAADLVRMFRIVHVETHDRVPAFHRFDQKIAGDYRYFAYSIAEIVDMLQRWVDAR